ncbi:MAG: conserved hypothetical rane spanning protein [Caulobacter sp.]|nr:conserved hypothetical rane spanning protein [Caulobacter sp.]
MADLFRSVSLFDALGVVGVLMILVAYGATILGGLKADGLWALAANFVGAGLILLSLSEKFNMASFLMEGSWALVALLGMIRLVFKRPPGDPPPAS